MTSTNFRMDYKWMLIKVNTHFLVFVSSLAVAFIDLTQLRARRLPRQTLPEAPYEENYHPIPLQNYHQGTIALAPPPPPEANARLRAKPQDEVKSSTTKRGAVTQIAQKPPDFGEYVDFGAHTGDNGAFGWYADYPVKK